MNRWQYVLVMGMCVALTLPLEFVFGARVWRRPRRLVKSLGPVVIAFTIWDIWATRRGTWSFDDRYTLGVRLPGGVVIEELLFFVVVPVCALLTIESIRNLSAGTTPLQRWLRRGG
jgi:lycopene cyclase domain-containing protein